MPQKRRVVSLEDLCLHTVTNLANGVHKKAMILIEQGVLLGLNKIDVDYSIEKLISDEQEHLFSSTAYCFHKTIISKLLEKFSLILKTQNKMSICQTDDRKSISSLSLKHRQLTWFKEEAFFKCVRLIASPIVTTIDVADICVAPQVVKHLLKHLHALPNLHTLNLGKVDCRSNNILGCGNIDNCSGMELQFVPRLKSVTLSSIDPVVFHSLSMFCPDVEVLTIHDTNIDDECVGWIISMKKLHSINFDGKSEVSPYSFAELLRNIHGLKHLGKCNCFGEVLTTMYSKWSLYHRSVGSMPHVLSIESVDCKGPISGQELAYIHKYCPNIKKLGLAYNRRTSLDMNEDSGHLNALAHLLKMKHLTVSSADFYSHSLFSVLRTGVNIHSLSLSNIDEMNLSAVMMIGSGCPNLASLTISCCHYTVELVDTSKLSQLCCEREVAKECAPFQKLETASFILTTPIQIPLIKYPIYFARKLKKLKLKMIYQPVEDSFVSALLSWNTMQYLEQIEIVNGPRLSMMAANSLIQACPNLKCIGKVSCWGKVEGEELLTMQREIRSRNLDLVVS